MIAVPTQSDEHPDALPAERIAGPVAPLPLESSGETGAADEDVFVFPATLAQRRFWLLEAMMPGGNPALNMPSAMRLRGQLNADALQRAFDEIIARHEILRTVFHMENGQLCQVISPGANLLLATVDPEDFPAGERARVPEHLLQEEAQAPFDLELGPLLRARLVRIRPDEHLLLITLHHIVSDAWSNGILLKELMAIYDAFARGLLPSLEELTIQFADFAQWQEDILARGGLDPQLAYWRKHLRGLSPSLALPLDHPRTLTRNVPGSEVCWRSLPETLAVSLAALAQRTGATPYMISLAAFTALLHQCCGGQEDILVSSPAAGRTRTELEGMIGPFASPLLLRFDLSGQPSFGDLLIQVRQTVLDAFANADVPFERLLEENLHLRRLQVNYLHHPAFVRDTWTKDLEWQPMRAATGGAIMDWTAGIEEETDGAQLFIEYNGGLFEVARIESILADFEAILSAVTAPGGLEVSVAALLGRSTVAGLVTGGEPPGLAMTIGEGAPFLTIHYQLIDIWQEVLGVEGIGIRDDFFALGGNSLLAMRMLSAIERTYGKALQPATLFKQATIEYLGETIIRRDQAAKEDSAALLRIQEGESRTPMFYLHGDLTGGGYYCMKLSAGLGADQPFYALPPVDVSGYREHLPSIEEMAGTHLRAIRSVRPHGPYVIGGFCLGGLVAYELARQLEEAGETVEKLVIIDADAYEPRLTRLRRMAEWRARREGLDNATKLHVFCKAHFFLARLDRWRGLEMNEQWQIARRRLGDVWDKVGRKLRGEPAAARYVQLPLSDATRKILGAAEKPREEADWFNPRWDVPLVFLWAEGGYTIKPYRGAMTLLLSQDVNAEEGEKLVRDWKRVAPDTRMRVLPGSHLACITEHIAELAGTIKQVLAD